MGPKKDKGLKISATSAKRKSESPSKKGHGSQSILTMFQRQHQIQHQIDKFDNSSTEVGKQKDSVNKVSPYFSPKKDEIMDTNKTGKSSGKLKLQKSNANTVRSNKGEFQSVENNIQEQKEQDQTCAENKDASSSEGQDDNKSHDRLSLKKRKKSFAQENKDGPVAKTSKLSVDDTGSSIKKRKSDESEQTVIPVKTSSSTDDNHIKTEEGCTVVTGNLTLGNEMKTQINNPDEVNKEQEEDGDGDTYKTPYYLENFVNILDTVLSDDFYNYLFNEMDREWVRAFRNISECSQKLYVRLFGRHYRWLRKGRIVYQNIAENLTEALAELCAVGLLFNENHLTDLDEILQVMAVPDLRQLAKTLRLNVTGLQQQQVIEAVVKHSKQSHIGSFFKQHPSQSAASKIIKTAKDTLGPCFKLTPDARAVFTRTIMLFAIHQTTGDEDEIAGSQQLFQMLMSNIGRVIYPEYSLNKTRRIFRDRSDLISYEHAMQLEADIFDAQQRSDWELAYQFYQDGRGKASEELANKANIKHDGALPEHLRLFTARSSFTRFLTQGVEVLQRRKDYKSAVTELENLLSRPVYHPDYRGRWYDRLALNEEQHLKKPAKALDIINRGLSDDRVRAGHRLSLLQRAERICHAPCYKKLHTRWIEFSGDDMTKVQDAPKITIEARRMPAAVPGGAAVWLTDDSHLHPDADVTFLTRVEDVAMQYYQRNGYPHGIHDEGGTFRCLFTLLLWDLLFEDSIPDTFLSRYQTSPLDLQTDDFYINRKEQLDAKLNTISQSSVEELCTLLENSWKAHAEVLCSGVKWDRFEDCEQLQGVIRCLGGKALAAILQRFVKWMRHHRSGLPDLLMWNTDTNRLKCVEVKGPNDRLSTKQIIWLDYFLKHGIDAEVCYVNAIGVKKIRT